MGDENMADENMGDENMGGGNMQPPCEPTDIGVGTCIILSLVTRELDTDVCCNGFLLPPGSCGEELACTLPGNL